jgi:hypothetical protein
MHEDLPHVGFPRIFVGELAAWKGAQCVGHCQALGKRKSGIFQSVLRSNGEEDAADCAVG